MVPSLILAAVLGAQVSIHEAFTLATPLQEVVRFAKANPSVFSSGAQWQILNRRTDPQLGSLVRVARSIPRGRIDMTLSEHVVYDPKQPTQAIYQAAMVECHQGGVANESIMVVLTAVGNKTHVAVWVTIAIPTMGDVLLRTGTHRAIRGLQRVMEARFGKG